jgi:enoyl-CoA hydratase
MADDAAPATVRLERSPELGIAEVVLDRPPLNAIDESVVLGLQAAAETLEAAEDVRAVVVRSAVEGMFMAGADVVLYEGMDEALVEQVLTVQELFTRWAELPMPTVAAINGHALGGGLELALACDFRFAGQGPGRLGLPEVRLGVIPGAGGTQRLTRLVGPGRATELIMKGLQLSSEEAFRDGIVHGVVPATELDDHARDYAVRLARQAPLALRAVKRAIRAAVTPDGYAVEREGFREVLLSEDAQAGVAAFLRGDRATFSGR